MTTRNHTAVDARTLPSRRAPPSVLARLGAGALLLGWLFGGQACAARGPGPATGDTVAPPEGVSCSIDEALSSAAHPAVDAALADVPRDDALRVLMALQPFRAPDVAAEERRAACLLGARAAAQLGLEPGVLAFAAEVLAPADAGPSALEELAALRLLVSGRAGPAQSWIPLVVDASPARWAEAVASAPASTREAVLSLMLAADVGSEAHRRALLAPGGSEELSFLAALLALQQDDEASAAAARTALLTLVAGGGPRGEHAQLLLAHLAVAEADAVREHVYDSPRFHGDAARAILDAAASEVARIPATSALAEQARAAETALRALAGRDAEAVAVWRSSSVEVRARQGASLTRWYVALHPDDEGICSLRAEVEAQVARVNARFDVPPPADDSRACALLSEDRALLALPLPDVFAYRSPPRAREWLASVEVAAVLAARRSAEESLARYHALPEAFRASDAGASLLTDHLLAQAFTATSCDQLRSGRANVRVDQLEQTRRTIDEYASRQLACVPPPAADLGDVW